MIPRRLPLTVLLGCLLALAAPAARATVDGPTADRTAPAEDPGRTARLAPAPRSPEIAEGDRRCTPDGALCIRLASYVADVCALIETAAAEAELDPHFFARLIWKESLFDASAVSPAGAEGIAQFMPGTAKLRGLKDAFNPAEALVASAEYLAEMRGTYGNLGLAAIGYNGGEARAERFIARAGGLPLETRDYVLAITGHPAEVWRDTPPETLDVALAPDIAFRPACIAQAENRRLKEFRPQLQPWGVIVASNRDRGGAERQVNRLKNRFAAVLGPEQVIYSTGRVGRPKRMHLAQIGRATRGEAEALCTRLRASGGDCMVLRN